MRRQVRGEVVIYRPKGEYIWTGLTRSMTTYGEPSGNWGTLYGKVPLHGKKLKGWTTSLYPPEGRENPNSPVFVIMVDDLKVADPNP